VHCETSRFGRRKIAGCALFKARLRNDASCLSEQKPKKQMVKSLLGFCSRVLAARRFESATKSCEWSRKHLSKPPHFSPILFTAGDGAASDTTAPTHRDPGRSSKPRLPSTNLPVRIEKSRASLQRIEYNQ